MTIWAHTIVKDEERYIWFSIMSVIDLVDKVLVYDTGSLDNTIGIVKELKKKYPNKIILEEVGDVDTDKFTEVRNAMLARTKADWFLILDADEVWWEDSIKKLVDLINENPSLESVVSQYYSLAGDIYHYQDSSSARYSIDEKMGHINIRAINLRIPGLHFAKPHGQQGLFDSKGQLIQERSKNLRHHSKDVSYLHFTNLKRSRRDVDVPKRSFKHRRISGIPFPGTFFYPEVFFIDRPSLVPSPWEKRSIEYEVLASIELPLRMFKKKLNFFEKSGY